jgi:prepilin-type N-terminal cleavage/methylation domain-containing protein
MNQGLSAQHSGRARAPGAPGHLSGFTIIEIMLAISIFSMVITAIYASWSAIIRASKVGADAAADIQRSRIASRTIQDALASAVMFAANRALYSFEADTSQDFAAISFVARLPSSFPGSGYFGDQVVRRVTFNVETAGDGTSQLMLRQTPLLLGETPAEDQQAIVLAREIKAFALDFWDNRAGEWIGEWAQTNMLPKMVRFTLAFGPLARDSTMRVVSLASTTVQQEWQAPRGGGAGGPVPGPPQGPPGGPGSRGRGPGQRGPGFADRSDVPMRTGGGGWRNDQMFQDRQFPPSDRLAPVQRQPGQRMFNYPDRGSYRFSPPQRQGGRP